MEPSQLLLEGFQLMLYGMGFVFAFLALLVLVVRLMSRLLSRFAAPEAAPAPLSAGVSSPSAAVDPILLAAIQAAVHQYRARRG